MNKINLHFTDVCNYSCTYCFAKKENKCLSESDLRIVVDHAKEYFVRNNISNPAINLAGGEIFTYNKLDELIDYISSQDIDCSIITNGYNLDDKFLEQNQGKISQIGISIDSLNDDTNIKIGRCLKNKKLLTYNDYLSLCKKIIKYGYQLKINICVSNLNCQETNLFKKFLDNFRDESLRIKVMRMVVVDNRNPHSIKYKLSNEEFDNFVEELSDYNVEIENEEIMFTKYLMINSDGDVVVHNECGTDLIIGNAISDSYALDRAVDKVHQVRKLFNIKTIRGCLNV